MQCAKLTLFDAEVAAAPHVWISRNHRLFQRVAGGRARWRKCASCNIYVDPAHKAPGDEQASVASEQAPDSGFRAFGLTAVRGNRIWTTMTNDPVSADHHRDLTVDTLRGVAILMVLVLHGIVMTMGLQDYPRLAELANRLGSGVQLFFVISGFVITASMDRALRYGDGVSGFLLRRIAKLFPLYIAFVHLHIAFFILWNAAEPEPFFFRNFVTYDNLTWSNYLIHVVFLQGFTPNYMNTIVDGGWSIVCEAYFYLLMPFVIHKVTKTISRAIWTLAGCLVISVMFSTLLGKQLGAFGYYAFPVQLPCFIMGIVCYRVREHVVPTLSPQVQLAVASLMILLFFGFTRLESAPLGGHVVMSLFFAAALFLLRVRGGAGLPGMIQWIGQQSYALFLIHILVLKIAYSTILAYGVPGGFWTSLAINLALSVLASLFLSWAVFDRIDRYFVRAMAKLLRRRRARDA
jgi:peptidoglycan/LPS O-acetylase OafA/YrhL